MLTEASSVRAIFTDMYVGGETVLRTNTCYLLINPLVTFKEQNYEGNDFEEICAI